MKIRSLGFVHFFVFLFTVLTCTISFAAAYRITAPKSWTLTFQDGDNAIFQNSKSKTYEGVILQVLRAGNNERDLLNTVTISDLTRERERFLRKVGIGNYTVLAIAKKRTLAATSKVYYQIDSSYRDFENVDMHMVERQYFLGGIMYVVSYVTSARSVSDHERVGYILDNFQPNTSFSAQVEVLQEKEIYAVKVGMERLQRLITSTFDYFVLKANAAEVMGSSPSRSQETSHDGNSAQPLFTNELPAGQPLSEQQCSGVPSEVRRSPTDEPFIRTLEATAAAPGNCIIGAFQGALNAAKGIYEILRFAALMQVSSTYRSEVESAVGPAINEFVRHPWAQGMRLGSTIANLAKRNYDRFVCLKPGEQTRVVCAVTAGLAPKRLIDKIAAGVSLTAAENAQLVEAINQAMDAAIRIVLPGQRAGALAAAGIPQRGPTSGGLASQPLRGAGTITEMANNNGGGGAREGSRPDGARNSPSRPPSYSHLRPISLPGVSPAIPRGPLRPGPIGQITVPAIQFPRTRWPTDAELNRMYIIDTSPNAITPPITDPMYMGQQGVKRVFGGSSRSRVPERPILEVAQELANGRNPDDLPVSYYVINGLKIAENNRSRTAFALAGMEPSVQVNLTRNFANLSPEKRREFLLRLYELDYAGKEKRSVTFGCLVGNEGYSSTAEVAEIRINKRLFIIADD